MADLSTLDPTAPTGSDPVSAGDDAIRATRDAVITSFGGADSGSGTQASEHFLKGFHKFPNGTTAARPAAGNAGRIYLNTETLSIDRDTGAAWAMLNAFQVQTATLVTSQALTTSYTTVCTKSVTVPTGARVFLLGWIMATTTTETTVRCKFVRDSTDLGTLFPASRVLAPQLCTIPVMQLETPSAGTYTYTLKALSGVASGSSAGGQFYAFLF